MSRTEDRVAMGEKLKSQRLYKGLSQSEVGKKVGYHYSVISRIESGLYPPSDDLLMIVEKICQVIDLSFLDLKNEFGMLTSREKAQIAALEKANQEKEHAWVLLRKTDQIRYYTGSRIERLEDSNFSHRLYRFNTNLKEAMKFKSKEKANEIARKLKNVVVKEYEECE